ncbi:MAG: DNA repair protein RadA, partial [Candidatus Hydrothermota bacterium]
ERGERLGIDLNGIEALAEADLERILEVASEFSPDYLFVDSIQTVYHPSLQSIPGTVSQVRECGAELLRFAKRTGCTVIIVGHVTKDGTLAGPRTLEHMVDAVLFFEGERTSGLRILRSIKNRFGSVDEIGVFEMGERGLVEVENPSFLFISEERRERTGVALTALLEGVRPLLVEVQALVLSSPFAVPQRTATGYDVKRLSMLLAVLEKRTGLLLRKSDVFINVTGGIRINESAADLGVAVAIVSSRKKKPLSGTDLFVGEVGLGGEIRPVRGLAQRLREARRMGMKRAFVPAGSKIDGDPGIEIVGINDINEVIEICVG